MKINYYYVSGGAVLIGLFIYAKKAADNAANNASAAQASADQSQITDLQNQLTNLQSTQSGSAFSNTLGSQLAGVIGSNTTAASQTSGNYVNASGILASLQSMLSGNSTTNAATLAQQAQTTQETLEANLVNNFLSNNTAAKAYATGFQFVPTNGGGFAVQNTFNGQLAGAPINNSGYNSLNNNSLFNSVTAKSS